MASTRGQSGTSVHKKEKALKTNLQQANSLKLRPHLKYHPTSFHPTSLPPNTTTTRPHPQNIPTSALPSKNVPVHTLRPQTLPLPQFPARGSRGQRDSPSARGKENQARRAQFDFQCTTLFHACCRGQAICFSFKQILNPFSIQQYSGGKQLTSVS